MEVEAGKTIKITFVLMDVEETPTCWLYDHLMIKDGNGEILLNGFCGINNPITKQSITNVVNVFFVSGAYTTSGAGWVFTWSSL